MITHDYFKEGNIWYFVLLRDGVARAEFPGNTKDEALAEAKHRYAQWRRSNRAGQRKEDSMLLEYYNYLRKL